MRCRARAGRLLGAAWAGTLVAVAFPCLPVRAEVEVVPLTWNAPDGCPRAEAVVAEVKRNLADSGKAAAPFVAAVIVRQGAGGRWQAQLRVETRGGRAERTFDAESCEAISAATALIVALSAESMVVAPVGSDPRELGQAADRESPPPAPEDHWQRTRVSLMASPVIDGGTMPNSPALGVEVGAGPEWQARGWRLRILGSAGIFPKRQTNNGVSSTGDIDLWLVTVAGRGCLTAAPRLFEFGFCLGVELSVMTGSDSTINEQVVDSTQVWVSPVASVLTVWRASRKFSLFGRADVAVPSTLRSYHVGIPSAYMGQVYEVDDIAVRGAVGFEVRFF